jgi:hypothetical protein
MNKSTVLLLCSAALLLAACGSGGGEPVAVAPAAADQIPDRASASAAGMAGWMTVLASESAETKEPLDVSKFAPPETDDTEPELLN